MKRGFLIVLAIGAAIVAGCAHPAQVGIIVGSPTPTASASSSPGACATPDQTDVNVVYVAVSADMTPAKDNAGKSIFGYAPYPGFLNGDTPPQTSAVVPATSGQLVQFLNVEPTTSTLSHSAVGFAANTFPPTPYTFPVNSDTQSGTMITKTVAVAGPPWSTGEIAASSFSDTGTYCASQVLRTQATGTFYYGDFNSYNSAASMRGEINVQP